MDLKQTRRVYACLTYLMYCGVEGVTPKRELIDAVGVDQLYRAAKRHSLGAMLYYVLEPLGLATRELTMEYTSSVRRVLLLDAERANIHAWMEEEKIRHMALKGVILKEFYPGVGLRQMADNDILFEPKYRKKVRDYFKSRGYKVDCYNHGNHDVYLKNPVYNYEMHVALFGYGYLRPMRERFINTLDRAILDPDTSYSYHMEDNEYYIYIKCHEYKHYTHGGIGLRFFLDSYVLLREMSERLDFDFITAECEKIGIRGYEARTRALTYRIFNMEMLESLCAYSGDGEGDPLTKEERELFDFSAFSGTYGTIEHHMATDIMRIESQNGGNLKKAKFKYFLGRLVLPMSAYESSHPFVFKHKWLIPFHAVWRLISAVFTKPKKVIYQLRSIIKFKKKK